MICGSHLKKKQTNIKGKREELEQHDVEETEGLIFFFYSLSLFLRFTKI